MNSNEFDNVLAKALESHSGFGPLIFLLAMGISWVFIITELLPVAFINEKFSGFTITPIMLLFFFVIANIYGLVLSINSRMFKKKLFEAAEEDGLSKTEMELFLLRHRNRSAALDGNLHGQAKKNIERLRKG